MAGKFNSSVPPHFLPAWVGKQLPAETGYIITLSFLVSQATLDALAADGATEGASPLWVQWFDSGQVDWLRLDYNGSIWQWGILQSALPPSITVTGDSCQTLRYRTTFVSGTTWHSKVEIDSGAGYVTVDEYDLDAFVDDTTTLFLATGGFNGWVNTTPEIYEVQDVTVTDNLGNPVFSDALETDFSAWDSEIGDCTIVAAFTCGGPGAPTITSFSPMFGPVGTEVTITGTGFTGATAVLFDGVTAPVYVVDSPTQIRVLVPAGASDGPLTVFTPGGSGESADSFSVTTGGRFFEGYPWRFLFTAVDVTDPDNPNVAVTTSWAQGLLTNRQITKALGQPTTIEADVWPDHVTVNEVWTDGYPRVAQTKRIVWAFRREGAVHVPDEVSPPNGPWVCRAAGILMQPEDEGDADVPLTHFIAYDSRKWLEARPAKDASGNLPGPNGFTTVSPVPGNTLALLYLKNTITFDGGVFLDAGVANGGTAFYSGIIETTPDVAFTVQQGSSVADVWNQLEQAGNLDIILTPIYDPVNRPGYTHEVSIYNLAGTAKHNAVFGWDRMNRCVTKIQRLHDATPGNFFDIIAVHAGQGGAPVPLTGPSVGSGTINAAALAAFGSYWMIQFFPTMLSTDPTGAAVLQLAVQALQMAKQGRRTLTMEITPERGPIPLIDYDLGDRVDIRVSKVLRVAADGLQRVEAMPFQIDDNGIERLPGLLVSPDWRGSGDS